MPKGSSVTDILTVMWNMMQLTDDKLVFSTQKDGSVRIKIASLGKGKKTAGTQLIRNLNSSDKTVTISLTENGNQEQNKNKASSINGNGSNANVFFNPNDNPDVPTVNSSNDNVIMRKRPSYIGLAHELIHADHAIMGISIDYLCVDVFKYKKSDDTYGIQMVPKEELSTIGLMKYHPKHNITENDIRKELGLPLRGAYYSTK